MAIKLGFGPYEEKSQNSASTIQARIYFFRAIETIEPAVVASLHEKVFKLFLCFIYLHFEVRIKADKPLASQSVDEAIQNICNIISPEEVKDLVHDWKSLGKINSAAPIGERLYEWAENWKLHEEWCLDYAIRAMRMWLFQGWQQNPPSWWFADSDQNCADDSMMINAIWADNSFLQFEKFLDSESDSEESDSEKSDSEKCGYRFIFNYGGLSYRDTGWNPFYTEIGVWKKKVRDEFNNRLRLLRKDGKPIPRGIKGAFKKHADKHVAKIRVRAKKRGIKPTPQKWDYDHFKWLVHYQIILPNWPLQKIAERYNADRITVSDGIKRTAQLIGLTLRAPLPAGRKPKA